MTRRHDGLIPLTHDHHHALGRVRRLKLAAGEDGDSRLRSAREFLESFESETIEHFREEEEIVFPLAIWSEDARPLLGTILTQHIEIHAHAARLSEEVAEGHVSEEAVLTLAKALEAHIRLEENRLFPLIERVVADERLSAMPLRRRDRAERLHD
jgi:iron-sulfur cluster repair protein YtfE (RIC family)